MNRVTLLWRRAVMRGLTATLPRRPRLAVPDWAAREHRVLFIRDQRIGDLLMATGTIRAIANSHPTVRVDVLVSPASATVLEGNAHVRRVLPFHRRKWWTWPRLMLELRRAKYDAVIDGQVNRTRPFTTELAVIAATRVSLRIGADLPPWNRIYTMPVPIAPNAHFVEQTAATAIPFGVDPASVDLHPELHMTVLERDRADGVWRSAAAADGNDSHSPRVLVNISVGESWRRWPEDRFTEVVKYLRRGSPQPVVLVIATPSDAAGAARIAAASGVSSLTPGLREAMAMVTTADALLTPNTALAHVASAVGVPVVEMMGRAHAEFAAYRTKGRSLLAPDNILTSISVEEVIDALEMVLQDLPRLRGQETGGGREQYHVS
jgi:ADP-heptose:LPS heptosyltransferase